MIPSKELRIGNILQAYADGTFLRTIELSEETQVFYVMDRSKHPLPDGWQAQAVPLTSELLTEKCGFLSDQTGKHWVGDFELYPVAGGFEHNGKTIITSVHHLMNIYYFIEGSELPVNF